MTTMTPSVIWRPRRFIWEAHDHNDDWSSYDELIEMAEEREITGIVLAMSLHLPEKYEHDLIGLWGNLTPVGKMNAIDWHLMFNRNFLRDQYDQWRYSR